MSSSSAFLIVPEYPHPNALFDPVRREEEMTHRIGRSFIYYHSDYSYYSYYYYYYYYYYHHYYYYY